MKTRQSYYLDEKYIVSTNSKLNEKTISTIIKEKINPIKLGAFPGIFTKKGFIITDGNHRLEAIRRIGLKYVPIILLDREEYVKIAGKKNTILFQVIPACCIIDADLIINK